MTLTEFFNSKIDDIEQSDIENAYFMRSLIGDEDYAINKVEKVSVMESVVRSLSTFDIYKSIPLNKEISVMKKKIAYMPYGDVSFCFGTQMLVGDDEEIIPTIIYPRELDKASYVFLGHEFHHALKDLNYSERKIRDRFAEVIPMFYEMICANEETDENVSKEIFKRRLILLNGDKAEETDDIIGQLQYFNSYYYALALFNRYEEDKLLILRLISRVLVGEISTLDLLNMLGIYEKDLDYTVSKELYNIKEYIHK
ncbi:MAG: hypothetical protein IJ097_01720 [Bacilli bacterium]|nr:hypothetical protein [Bacilli bacterium]